MSAGEAVLAALETALALRMAVERRATGALPRRETALLATSDWSTKTEAGLELQTRVTLRVGEAQAGRLPGLCVGAERAGQSLRGVLPGGWRVASAVHVRTRMASERGVKLAAVEHRVRVMQEN